MDKLQEICAKKLEHIAAQKLKMPIAELREIAKDAPPPRGFEKALREKEYDGKFAVIAELKKASPSRGLIRADFDVEKLAKAYEAGGATALSVLTDAPYFQGADEFVKIAKAATNLPILRKDFMLDPYQVHESRALGADAILVIMAAVSDAQAQDLISVALRYEMDVLIEVHDREELNRALYFRTKLIGVNNRNLKTMEVDLKTSEKLSNSIPGSYLRVCESGVFAHQDLLRMRKSWYNTFLVGESLMAQGDVERALKILLGN
jgi:indole-3-glycerol phosphate synthase